MSARERIIPVFVPHLGCPHRCVFCDQRRISGAETAATAQTVADAVRAAPAGEGYELAFYGGSFTAVSREKQIELLAAAQPYRESGRIGAIRVSTRPDAVDAQRLFLLREYGVQTVELGVQSMDDEVLRLSGRGHSAADAERAAACVKDAGQRLILQMMTGLPGDSEEKSVETARRIIALSPDAVRIYPTVIVRGTELEALWRAGAYREHTVEDAVRLCARLLPMFEEASVPVIRLGLNPTEELSGGQALAGAYHPALGELVHSRILYERARSRMGAVPAGSRVTLGVNPSQVSQMIGQHRENINRLCAEFGLAGLRVAAANVRRGAIALLSCEENTKGPETAVSRDNRCI